MFWEKNSNLVVEFSSVNSTDDHDKRLDTPVRYFSVFSPGLNLERQFSLRESQKVKV